MKHNLRFTATALLVTVLIIVSCGKTTDPVENIDPVLSVGTISHFHCELSWTQHNRPNHEHDSYTLYRSESPGIASDTSNAEFVVSFNEIDQLQHADSTLEAGGDYYYSLLTKMHESSSDQDVSVWSNEVHVAALEVIPVTVVNNYGQTIYVMVHHNKIIPQSPPDPPVLISYWLKNMGDEEQWEEDFDQSSCVCTVTVGSNFEFNYPEYQNGSGFTWGGPRVYFGENSFDTIPNLMTADFIYDKIETNWGPGAVWNTTCVDFFAIPIQIKVNNDSIGLMESRSTILNSLNAMGAPYDTLNYNDVRFFSPSKKPELVSQLLDSAITLGLPLLLNKTFSWNWEYTVNSVTDNSLTATCAAGGGVTLSNIKTTEVLACAIVYKSSGDLPTGADANLAGVIGAAANRGVLYDSNLWDNPFYYYINDSLNNNQYNQYSRILHNFSIRNLCYAFPYDDNQKQDPSLEPNQGGVISPVTITILPK